MEQYFLVQIKRTNEVFEKGVVVKATLNDARQSYHAYLGAYGYGKDSKTDYVQCAILDISGRVRDAIVDDRIPIPEPEPEPEPEPTAGE